MLSETSKIKKPKPLKFQVLFLRNSGGQEVEVHEVGEVDFLTVQEHLAQGESVFITSKNSQKVIAPKPSRTFNTKLVTAFSLEGSI